MKITIFFFLLLTLAACGRSAGASLENSTHGPEASTSVSSGEDLTQKEEEEGREEGGRTPQEDRDAEALQGGAEGKEASTEDSLKERLLSALLPRPEALQGGRWSPSRQGSPQVLSGLHLGRIPASCALCSRERNLCRIISGIFIRSPLPYGYSLVTPVPAGVCNLTIAEMKPSKNFFALRRSDGTYVLNGNWDIEAEGEYRIAGTTFVYTPSGEERGERLSARGPLREPIDLMLISQSPNPGIEYEYRVPLLEYLAGNPGGGLGPPPGGAPFEPLPQGGPPDYRVVPGRLFPYEADGRARPLVPVLKPVRSPEEAGFNASSFGRGLPLDPPGGPPGVLSTQQKQQKQEKEVVKAPGGVPSPWRPAYPVRRHPTRPEGGASTERRTRHRHGSETGKGRREGAGKPPSLLPSVFGFGVQLTQSNTTPSASSGNATVPINPPGRRDKGGRRRHRQEEGPQVEGKRRRKDRRGRHRGSRFHWAEKGFTPCSRSCGGGTKTAILSCERRRNRKVVPDRRCSRMPRPESHGAACGLTPCPAAWLPGEWGPCSVTCGMGVQTRRLACRQVVSPTLTMTVPEGACLSPPPPVVPTSQVRPIREGGHASSRRPPRHLAASPSLRQVCEMPRCGSASSPEWRAQPWGNCSVPCGLGTRRRRVECLPEPQGEGGGGGGGRAPACDAGAKPPQEEACDMGSCATRTWFFSEWARECSESCGTGIQTRRVHCLLSGGDGPEGRCPPSSRPDSSRPCRGEKGCGGQWFVGPWDGCDVDCGVGRESRPVLCVVLSGGRWRLTLDSLCRVESRPQDRRQCNPGPCGPEWYTSEWSQCSASCDGGTMRREVTCLDVSQRPSADCLNATKPESRQPCGLQPCGVRTPSGPPARAAANHSLDGGADVTVPSDDFGGEEDVDAVTEQPDEDDATDDEMHKEEEKEGEEEEEEEKEVEGEEENELIVEETTGSALNVIPDKDAQGDESVSDDVDERDREEEEEEERKKKRKRNKDKKKKQKKNGDRKDENGPSKALGGRKKESPATNRPVCIDRIKNCHLVFRARLCRLKYYNQHCCRTCSST